MATASFSNTIAGSCLLMADLGSPIHAIFHPMSMFIGLLKTSSGSSRIYPIGLDLINLNSSILLSLLTTMRTIRTGLPIFLGFCKAFFCLISMTNFMSCWKASGCQSSQWQLANRTGLDEQI
ncbi:hypothetical protein M378DRAFT_395447 [Amanita muscaria Koide BX008]|uniref:Uncharacterized protein n=1 Tax=Amanita muscaria (strain Koide BX008) TaxID=946122 RepID=A0A0C2WKW4_AMAMK|nr:hypothetical protein M378DRAFT_395447 [Amanita muscaria Koide BX008]